MMRITSTLVAICWLFTASAVAKTYVDTEQKYIFTAENVAETIPFFVENETRQLAMARKYTSLMNQETGAVSVADLFAICRAGGMNTYKQAGFEACRNFVDALLEKSNITMAEGQMDGFCPGLDENGKNPNKLSTITDKTRVGDMCTSSHIAMGEVVFQRNNSYSCTCMALACNGNYDLRGGACNTPIPVGTPTCARSTHKESKDNNTTAKCLEFCKAKGTRENCAVTNVVMRHSTKECICNANGPEISAAKESMSRAARNVPCPTGVYPQNAQNNTLQLCTKFCQAQAKTNNCKLVNAVIRHSANQCVCNPDAGILQTSNIYRAVCGQDKGKTGKKEYCIDDVFSGWGGGTNVQIMQAVALAQEYARVKHGDTIVCSTKRRSSWPDDYIQCKSSNGSAYYEFKFDDVKESVDKDIQNHVQMAICNKIYGGGWRPDECSNISRQTCTGNFATTARKLGFNVKYQDGKCRFVTIGGKSNTIKEVPGIDSYRFYSGDIQFQATSMLENHLRTYVQSVKSGVKTFKCVQNARQMSEIEGHSVQGPSDDVLRCTINGSQEIDFVFDDLSESWDYVSEKGESGMQCIISGGKFTGAKCHGLNKQQCIDAGKKLQQAVPGSSGTRWDGKNCVLVDGDEAEVYDGAVNIGLGVIGAVDCAFGTKVGCVLFMVEAAGLATEMTTGTYIKARADDFLSVSTQCKSRPCALSAIRDLGGRVMSVQNALGDSASKSVDEELARLIELLEPQDLGPLLGTDDWAAVVKQLGGDPNDWGGRLLVYANNIGLIAQFASVGASGLRLTGRAIAKVAGKESRLGRAGTKMANFLETSKKTGQTADAASDSARGASRGTGGANDADNAANAAGNPHGPADGGPAGGAGGAETGGARSADDAARGADDAANTGRNTSGNTGGNTGGANNASGGAGRTDTGNTSNGASGAAGTGRAASGAAGDAASGLHPDLENFNLRRFGQKYHPDKAPASMASDADEIMRRAADFASMSDAEKQAFSQMLRDFDTKVVTERLAQDIARAEEHLDDMLHNLNTHRRDATIRTLSSDIDTLRERAQAARAAGATADAGRAEDAIRRMEQALENATDIETDRVIKAFENRAPSPVRQGVIELAEEDENKIVEAIIKKRSGELSLAEHRKAIDIMYKYFDEGAAKRYAFDMRNRLIVSMREDDEVMDILDEYISNKSVAENVTKFAQKMVDHLSAIYGLDGRLTVKMYDFQGRGYAMYDNGIIYIKKVMGGVRQDRLLDEYINIVTHEFGHAVDDLRPEMGVIGEKLSVFGNTDGLYANYMDIGHEYYKKIPTEASSHIIGDIVSGRTNYGMAETVNPGQTLFWDELLGE